MLKDEATEQPAEVPTEPNGAEMVLLSVSLPLNADTFKVAVPASTSVGDLRALLIDSPETQFNTNFFLAKDGARLSDAAQIGDAVSLNSEQNEMAPVSVAMVTDEFNEREVRIQIARLREILTGFKSSTASPFGIDVGVNYLQALSGDHDINPLPREKDEKKQGEQSTKTTSLSHPWIKYDFDVSNPHEDMANLLPFAFELTSSDCLKSLTVSVWNPPPPHRRTAGDIMYLQATTNESTTHHITCSVNGFYVSRSTQSNFDPTLKAFAGPTLPSVLSQLSPSFKTKFAAFHKSVQRRHPHTYFLPATPQATPWLVREPKHTPDPSRTLDTIVSLADNADLLATRDWNDELCMAAALPASTHSERVTRSTALHRVYNEFQEAATRGVAAIVQKSLAGNLGPSTGSDEQEEADALGAGQMYMHAGIFYSFAKDQVESHPLTGGAAAAHVAVSKDVDGVRKFDAVCGAAGLGVYSLGTCVVDYKGYRVVAQSVIPGILKRGPQPERVEGDDGSTTAANDVIVYGSIDSGKTVLSNPEFHATAKKIAGLLHLDSHKIVDEAGAEHTLATPLDLKGIVGTDGRQYVLDLGRLTPADSEFLEQIEKDGETLPAYPHRLTVLRHDLMDLYCEQRLGSFIAEKRAAEEKKRAAEEAGETVEEERKFWIFWVCVALTVDFLPAAEPFEDVKWNPDVFIVPDATESAETPELKAQKATVRSISKFLTETVIPAIVCILSLSRGMHFFHALTIQPTTPQIIDLSSNPGSVPVDGQRLTKFLHERGVNMRYLGRLARALAEIDGESTSYAQELIVQEMIIRAAKTVLRELLQEIPLHHSSECIAHFLNCLYAGKDASVPIAKPWNLSKDFAYFSVTPGLLDERIRTEVARRFRYPQSHLPASLVARRRLPLLRSLCLKVGIQLKAKQYDFTKNPAFEVTDVLNIYPVAKFPEPGCSFGDDLQQHALFTLRNGDKKVGLEFLTESLNVYEQAFGPLHPDVAKVQRQLAMFHHENDDTELSKIFQRRALLISERLNGFDDPDTLQQYLNLAYFECGSGNNEVGFKYMSHALKYLQMHCAELRHPELAAADGENVMLNSFKTQIAMSIGELDPEVCLKFLARTIATYKLTLGQEHEQTIRTKQMYFNNLLNVGDFVTALEVQEDLVVHAKSRVTEDDEKSKETFEQAEKILGYLKRRVEFDVAVAAGEVATTAATAAPAAANGNLGKVKLPASVGKSKSKSKAGSKGVNATTNPTLSAAVAAGPAETFTPSKGHLPIDEIMKFIDGGSTNGPSLLEHILRGIRDHSDASIQKEAEEEDKHGIEDYVEPQQERSWWQVKRTDFKARNIGTSSDSTDLLEGLEHVQPESELVLAHSRSSRLPLFKLSEKTHTEGVAFISSSFISYLCVDNMYTQSLSKWTKLKQYQFEVTFGLLVLEPLEKLLVYAVLASLLSFFVLRGILCVPIWMLHGFAKRWSIICCLWGFAMAQAGNRTISSVCGPNGILACDNTYQPLTLTPSSIFSLSNCILDACPVIIGQVGSQIYLSNVTFKNSFAQLGTMGSVLRLSGSTAVINNARFLNNSAPNGGALYIEKGSIVDITDALFDGNQATQGSSLGGGDMLVQYSSVVTCTKCRSQNARSKSVGAAAYVNTASTLNWNGGSCINNTASWGGCLMIDAASTVHANSLFIQTVTATAGGAIFLNHESVFNGTNITMIGNSASAQGGCFYSYSGCTTTCYECRIDSCSTAGFGGTAVTQEGSSMSLYNSSVTNSQAPNGPGGAFLLLGGSFLTLDHSEIRGAVAENGAAIENQGATINIRNSVIDNCTATDSSMGGGVYESISGSEFFSTNSIFSNNAGADGGAFRLGRADYVEFGEGTVIMNNVASTGGAISATHGAKVAFNSSCVVTGNSAQLIGGAFYIDTGNITLKGSSRHMTLANNSAPIGSLAWIQSQPGGSIQILSNETMFNNIDGDIFVLHSATASIMLKQGLPANLPNVHFHGTAASLSVLNATNFNNSVINFASSLPPFCVVARDMFGNLASVNLHAPVIVNVSEVSVSASIAGETIKAILDDRTRSVCFNSLRLNQPGDFELQVQGVPGTLDLPPIIVYPKFSVTVAVCNPEEEILYTAGLYCVPIKNPASSTRIGTATASAAILAFILINLALMIRHRRLKLIRSNSTRFLIASLLGCALSLGSIVVQGKKYAGSCATAIILDNIGFALVFGSLCVKSVRIQVLFDDKRSQKKKINMAKIYSDNVLTIWVFLGCAVMGIFLAFWFILDRVEPVTMVNAVEAVTERCNMATSWGISLTVIRIVVIFFASFMAYQIRNVPSVFNESKLLGFTCYNWFIFSALLNALAEFSINDPDVDFIVSSVAVIVPTLTTVILLHSFKLWICITDPNRARLMDMELSDTGDGGNNQVPSKGSIGATKAGVGFVSK
ncbi:clustered mitochondria-domain-containing protein [Chytriomyces sp. MP71]|nr:clustered mitochondria-domain-containing protein [Chytriomyces sp. MP71]